jgi:hypothetical protein
MIHPVCLFAIENKLLNHPFSIARIAVSSFEHLKMVKILKDLDYHHVYLGLIRNRLELDQCGKGVWVGLEAMNLQNPVKKSSLLEVSPNLRISDMCEEQPILLEEESTLN